MVLYLTFSVHGCLLALHYLATYAVDAWGSFCFNTARAWQLNLDYMILIIAWIGPQVPYCGCIWLSGSLAAKRRWKFQNNLSSSLLPLLHNLTGWRWKFKHATWVKFCGRRCKTANVVNVERLNFLTSPKTTSDVPWICGFSKSISVKILHRFHTDLMAFIWTIAVPSTLTL